MALKTVIHHQVPVTNLRSSSDWYVNILGFELERDIKSNDKIAFLHLPDRGAAIHLVETKDLTRLCIESEHENNYIIGFYCENIEELYYKLQKSGVNAKLDDGGECGWWLYFNDPDGNQYFAAEDK